MVVPMMDRSWAPWRFLTLCLFYYGFSLFHARQSVPALNLSPRPIPWSRREPEGSLAIQGPGTVARTEFILCPHGTGLAQIFKVARHPGRPFGVGQPGSGDFRRHLVGDLPCGRGYNR